MRRQRDEGFSKVEEWLGPLGGRRAGCLFHDHPNPAGGPPVFRPARVLLGQEDPNVSPDNCREKHLLGGDASPDQNRPPLGASEAFAVNIIEAAHDDQIFGRHFRGETWLPWFAFLCALFALPMSAEQLELYRRCTGRTSAPTKPFTSAYLICGRRAGKSFILACIAIFLACFRDWRPHLQVGETGTIMIVAADKKQARTIMRYCLGLLRATPLLKKQIAAHSADSITLKNGIVVEIFAASPSSTRGYTVVAALLDELARLPDMESVRSDTEVIAAIRPSLATVPGSMMLCASSPGRQSGALWTAFDQHYGRDDSNVLVWKAPTRTMNVNVPQSLVDAALAEDASIGAAEWLGEFRQGISSYLDDATLAAAVDHDRPLELPPVRGLHYRAFVDASGGRDSHYTLAIGHRKDGRFVIDVLRGYAPTASFDPAVATRELSETVKRYGCNGEVFGDNFAAEWVKAAWEREGLRYRLCKLTSASLVYLEVYPLFVQHIVALPDHPRLLRELRLLERVCSPTGRDQVKRPRHGSDDYAAAVGGCLYQCMQRFGFLDSDGWLDRPDRPDEEERGGGRAAVNAWFEAIRLYG
jgi:hypothetical protein